MTAVKKDIPPIENGTDAYGEDLLIASVGRPVTVMGIAVQLAEITGVEFAVAEEEAAALVKRLREYHDS